MPVTEYVDHHSLPPPHTFAEGPALPDTSTFT